MFPGNQSRKVNRLQEKLGLKDFYRRVDPAREKNVDPMFMQFDIYDIAEALMNKYGKLPMGWSRYKDRPDNDENQNIQQHVTEPEKLNISVKTEANEVFTNVTDEVNMSDTETSISDTESVLSDTPGSLLEQLALLKQSSQVSEVQFQAIQQAIQRIEALENRI